MSCWSVMMEMVVGDSEGEVLSVYGSAGCLVKEARGQEAHNCKAGGHGGCRFEMKYKMDVRLQWRMC